MGNMNHDSHSCIGKPTTDLTGACGQGGKPRPVQASQEQPGQRGGGGNGGPAQPGTMEALTPTTDQEGPTHESDQPVRHRDHCAQGHVSGHPGRCDRTDRHARPLLGCSTGRLRETGEAGTRHCAAADVHGAIRRETSTTRGRADEAYGSRINATLNSPAENQGPAAS